MIYTEKMIQEAKAQSGSVALAYIGELEQRLQFVMKKFLADIGLEIADLAILEDAVVLQEPTIASEGAPLMTIQQQVNGLGDAITLYLDHPDASERPCVTWSGCAGYSDMSFYTETPEKAQALFIALLAVSDVECD